MRPLISNPYSHLTARKRNRLSAAARLLLERGLLTGQVLDYGCGFGTDVALLRAQGISIEGYDPHYAPAMPRQQFDTILCNQVLDILLPAEQDAVLMQVAYLLKPGGKAYFAVRRDVRTEGFRSHKEHRLPVYQCRVQLPYPSLFRSERLEVYEYWHYSWLHRGNGAVCAFFEQEALCRLIVETPLAFAIYHPHPQQPGHALILPKRQHLDFFDLPAEEQRACWEMAAAIRTILADELQATGFELRLRSGGARPAGIPATFLELLPA